MQIDCKSSIDKRTQKSPLLLGVVTRIAEAAADGDAVEKRMSYTAARHS
jgi:hypothetical protein